jgi:invasion protein IalB
MLAFSGAVQAQTAVTAQDAVPPVSDVTGAQGASPPWGIACRALAPGRTQCSLFHRQVLESGQQVLALELVGLGKGETPGLLITLPLGISLSLPPAITVDGTAPEPAPGWLACTEQGCLARTEGAAMLDALTAGRTLKLVAQTAGQGAQPLSFDIPLAGLASGLAAIRAEE